MYLFLLSYHIPLVVPITNVDGYLYTQTNRLWRKNRRVDPKTNCVGVDINRNWLVVDYYYLLSIIIYYLLSLIYRS